MAYHNPEEFEIQKRAAARNTFRKLVLAVLAVLIGLPLLVVGFYCFKNPYTPPGHEGYIKRGAVVGKVSYYGMQAGPASTGLGWLLYSENIDFRWKTYSEAFMVMSADNLELNFNAHIVMRPRPGSVRELVEIYGAEQWYDRTIAEPFRNAVYEAVAGYKALEAKDKREIIAETVRTKFNAYIKGKPFQVSSIVIGTINLPPQVARSQEQKISKQTELEQKDFEVAIERKKKEIRVIEAEGIAASQKIINTTLTPLYLQHEAIQAQMQMASSPNHTTVYIPSGTNGIPLVKTIP
jgi:hypothetical protein